MMKNKLLIAAFVLCTSVAFVQNQRYKFGFSAGGTIQHYNGNLGNSFFKFQTTTFAGVTSNFGIYINKSFDFNTGFSIGHFGYCSTVTDKQRVVDLEYRCPGCTNTFGMGDLRSLMVSGNMAIKYKFANGYILKENAKIAPYFYTGLGINYLSDVMKRNCVNVGTHFTLNGGVGVKYNINERFNFSYNLAIGCFMAKKVYASNGFTSASEEHDDDDVKIEHRKDFYMQNALTFGVNF